MVSIRNLQRAIVAVAFCLAAQQFPLSGQNADKPNPTFSDFPYGSHERQVFDLWVTETPDSKPTPLAIYIHGGGFRSGDKSSINASSIDQFRKAGISVAAINYRLSDTGPMPIMLEDAARCLQTIRSRAAEWSIDPERIACYGGSAGAGISLWLAFHDDLVDPNSPDPIARQSTRILAAATRNGQSTYDLKDYARWFGLDKYIIHEAFYPMYDVEADIEFESPRVTKLMEEVSAMPHLSSGDPPVFMLYGRGNVPVGPKTNPGIWVHHVLLGLKLQSAMEEMNLECIVQSPDHPDNNYGSMERFLIEKLTEVR